MIARIASVEKAAKADKLDHDYGIRSSRLVVEKVYKGDVRVGDELVFAQGNGVNCLMRFSEETIGDRMLLYEGRPPAGTPWSVSFCGRSARIERATEDLLYLDKMDELRDKTRVSGKYVGGFYGRELKVGGRKIRIVSDADAYETTTDDKGVFEIYGLPPGNYRLEPELDPGINLDPYWIGFSGFSRDRLCTKSRFRAATPPDVRRRLCLAVTALLVLGLRPSFGLWLKIVGVWPGPGAQPHF